MGLHLSQEPESDRFLTENPLALVIGMVLDQQIRIEHAFAGPLELQRRLGRKLTAATIAGMDRQELRDLFAQRQSLHRFPGAMADRVGQLCRMVVDEWGGDVSRVWTTATSGEELVARIEQLPGFGKQKARIFTALLGKQLGCRPPGWREAAGPFGAAGSLLSVADITDKATLSKVREAKRAKKAEQAAAT